MCVILKDANTTDTRAYGYVGPFENGTARHYVGYQNIVDMDSVNSDEPNVMFLNYACVPGSLDLIMPATRTETMMADITRLLPELQIDEDGISWLGGGRSVKIEQYGGYTTLRAQNPHEIVEEARRIHKQWSVDSLEKLEALASFFANNKPEDTFLLLFFNRPAKPVYPAVVSYIPRDPSVLTIPGLEAHGTLPEIGAPVRRDFHVAVGAHGYDLECDVHYRDQDVDERWAPMSITGFYDNRFNGPNGDYALPVWAVQQNLFGGELAEQLLDTHL